MTRKTAAIADQGPTGSPALRAASLRFGITPESGGPTYSGTGVVIGEVLGALDLTIPCGYANAGYPYITDAPNTGDSEYMSACYRYTEYLPPLKKPAGDVLARGAVKCLKRFAREKRHER